MKQQDLFSEPIPTQLAPGRAKAKRADKIPWNDQMYVAEPKLDGWRFLMHFGGDLPRVYLTGRRVSVETKLMSEKGSLVPEMWPTYDRGVGLTVIDGEVMAPGGFLSSASFLNSSRDRVAFNITKYGVPKFVAFDVLFDDGHDVRNYALRDRRTRLERIVGSLGGDHVLLIERVPNEKSAYDAIVASGGEGVILKHNFAAYGDDWIKVKKNVTVDVIVTGFKPAKYGVTGKYDGQIGSVTVGVVDEYDHVIEVGNVSGMDDAMRIDISENKEDWIGRVIEVRCQEFGKNRLRHPRFERVRDDLGRADATLSKMRSVMGIADDDE